MLKGLIPALVASAGLALAPAVSRADPGPSGPGWYFISICGLYGDAAARFCWLGQAAYFGPYTTEASCTSTVQLLINTNSIFVTYPYAPSSCFYMN